MAICYIFLKKGQRRIKVGHEWGGGVKDYEQFHIIQDYEEPQYEFNF